MSQADSAKRNPLIPGLVLAVLLVIVYAPCFRYPFTYFDDQVYVSENPHVLSGLTVANVRWAFTTGEGGNWHPLTWLSLQLDRTIYGDNAGGFHSTNFLLHLASTLALLVVLTEMTGHLWRSTFVAALFALHPLNVESVAWVAERKGVLSTLFWMLSLAAYLAYVRRPSFGRYGLLLLTLVLGLMAKPTLVTLPFVLLLLDYWPLSRRGADRSWRQLVREKIPLFVVVLLWCGIAYLTQQRVGALPSLEKYPLGVRLLNALLAYVTYLGKLFWPMNLAAHYPHPGAAVSVGAAVAAGLLLCVLTLLAFAVRRRRPYYLVGWLWYLGTLVPMIGLVQISDRSMADRYTYVPMIGIFILLTWSVTDLTRLPRLARIALGSAVIAACTILTVLQVRYWQSDQQLWEHAIVVTTNNALAHNSLGIYDVRQGRLRQAAKEFETAVAIAPHAALYQHNYALALRNLGRLDEALTPGRRAVELDPDDAVYHLTLANVLRDLGRDEEALTEFRAAVLLAPENPGFHFLLANQLLEVGKSHEARKEYQRVIDLNQDNAAVHVGLGSALAQSGQREQATVEFQHAIERDPKNAVAHYHLALNLQAQGQLTQALKEYRLAMDHGYAQAGPQMKVCEQLQRLSPRLPDLLAGRVQPKDNDERLSFAHLCTQPFEERFALAARLYAEAFRTEPSKADDPRTGFHLQAAISAARAGCGQGKDAAELKEPERAKLRRQTLDWLQADLTRWKQMAADTPLETKAALMQTLRIWRYNDGMACLREPEQLKRLPEEERIAWQKLWQEVQSLAKEVTSAPGERMRTGR